MRDNNVCGCVSHCNTPLYMISTCAYSCIDVVGLVVMEIAVAVKIKVAILEVETTEVNSSVLLIATCIFNMARVLLCTVTHAYCNHTNRYMYATLEHVHILTYLVTSSI